VNFTKICPCFGFADVTQNVNMRSSKNLGFQLLMLLFVTPQPFLSEPQVGNHWSIRIRLGHSLPFRWILMALWSK